MTRLDRHLLVILFLVGITALAAGVGPPARSLADGAERALLKMPTDLGPWEAVAASAEDLLPTDARSLESLSRVYARGERRFWVGVARYPGVNGPETRPGLHIIPEHGLSSLARETATFRLDGPEAMSTIRMVARFSDRQVTAWYWYQLGPRIIAGEYALRFWLGVSTLLRREEPLLLVRVATLGDDDPSELLRFLLPHVDSTVQVAERK